MVKIEKTNSIGDGHFSEDEIEESEEEAEGEETVDIINTRDQSSKFRSTQGVRMTKSKPIVKINQYEVRH